jgi:protein-disulfide isomerase
MRFLGRTFFYSLRYASVRGLMLVGTTQFLGDYLIMKITIAQWYFGLAIATFGAIPSVGFAAEPAFKVFGTTVSMEDVAKEKQGEFYEMDRKKFDMVEGMAQSMFLEKFWEKKGTDGKISVQEARHNYMTKNVKVSDKEIKEMAEKHKDNPQFSKFSKDEQIKQIRDFLTERASRSIEGEIIRQGVKSGDLVVNFPQPKEPLFAIALNENDHTRFGPGADDTKTMGCDRKTCPITVVEFSEFQCHYCSQAMPAVKRVLTEYRGKISWTVRDFPLSFHDRARSAATAAHCAGDQGKFWHLYTSMFENQAKLSDGDLKSYAHKAVGDKAKWDACFANQAGKSQIIDANMDSGMKVGVSGTPAFFINGRRLSGALPYEEFKRVIDEEIGKGRKS